jgi:hypothetical protein
MRYGPAGLALKLEINLIPAYGIYPTERSEGVYPAECNEGVVVVPDRLLRSTVKNAQRARPKKR